MGHGKLRKFAENETFRCLLQPDASAVLDKQAGTRELVLRDHAIKGNWNRDMFAAPQPIVLELGCGKGDYTIALAERHPELNFIGVDIKGARLWKGAKYATEQALPNVAFLRTRIEFLPAFFGPGEVSEIWLTFSDPQLHSENSRLSSPLFLARYRSLMAPGGIVHLKTDSRFLHEYTKAVVRAANLDVLASGTDIYHEGVTLKGSPESVCPGNLWPPSAALEGGARWPEGTVGGTRTEGPKGSLGTQAPVALVASSNLRDIDAVFEVQTFYEKMFLEMGLPITYLAFRIDHEGDYPYPEDFDEDYWRAAEGPRRTFSHQPAPRA